MSQPGETACQDAVGTAADGVCTDLEERASAHFQARICAARYALGEAATALSVLVGSSLVNNGLNASTKDLYERVTAMDEPLERLLVQIGKHFAGRDRDD